ncbi:GLUG motif-containing protein [Candidatus Enterococcus mangumiae]|uniref:GLUG domain-containing protein n=1 Tax=Candidatus Enterococcus mangumiae TaxID=2230878 RepID=A0ABZ2SSI6_9ENTE|nr:GLUG motif-containing protein [Enterococcus sp. DIV1094]MBO0490952.1 LPXTG cell wall anchor domain-containing protein [Enterococcus sp. DIV1094]
MVKLNKKKLMASVLLSSMVFAQTAPTIASALEESDPNRKTVIEAESIDEKIENSNDETLINQVAPDELEVLEEASNVETIPEDIDQETVETTEQLIEEQQTLLEEMEEQNETVIESYFSGAGDGSISAPFQITTEAELHEMRNDLTAHYQLMNDITLTSEWIPVGYGLTLATKFTGSFTAEPGTVIHNVRVNSGAQAGDVSNRGFFGVVDGATISGITLEKPHIVGGLNGLNTGGLIGQINDQSGNPTTVTDSAISGGIIEATGGSVGGLVGYMANRVSGTMVLRSSSSATITVNANPNMYPQAVGGLIGINGNVVVDSYATGNVTANATNTGGLVGLNSLGVVRRSYATGNVDGQDNDNIGGLIGGQDFYSTVVDSYATGDVIGRENVGGFIGAVYSYNTVVARNYSTGSVVGTSYVGGFIGNADNLTIENSFGMGDVTGDSNVDHFGLGGTNSNNFYYNNAEVRSQGMLVSGQVTPNVIEPLDVIELRTQSTYEANGWDFGSTWVWDAASNYPKLGLGNEIDTLPIDALGETLQVPYGGAETRIPLIEAFSLFGRGGNPEDYLFETDADGVSLSDDGDYLILEITSIGTYEITATPINRLTTLEPGQNWNKAIVEITPGEIVLEKGTVYTRAFNGTTGIDHFDAPTLSGLAPGDEVTWIEGDFQYTDSAAGTNTIEGANWTLDWGTIDNSNYVITGLPTIGSDEYLVTDIFDVEAITKANGAFLKIDEELAAQNNTHEVITIAGTALLHHDDTPDTPGEQWYHDHAEELLQDVTFLIYDTDPQANPLARVVAYADGIAAVDGAFVGLSANTTYWITATSDESANFNAGEESDPIVLTTSLSGDNGGNGDNGGDNGGNGGTGGNTGNTGNTGNNISAPSGNNQTGTIPNGGSVNTSGNGNGSIPTNAASAGNNSRSGNLPKTGEVASTFVLLGFGAVGTALASWLKRKKN